jgi:hypothetical protein
MLRTCWVIFRENDNGKFLPEDDPAGSKHVGVCFNWRKKLLVHSLVFEVFCMETHVSVSLDKEGRKERLSVSFPVAQQPRSGLGRLLSEVSRPHLVGLLWTTDQTVAEKNDWTTVTNFRTLQTLTPRLKRGKQKKGHQCPLKTCAAL